MELAELVIPIELGDKKLNMRFSANSMVAFEQVTGKFFMDTVSALYDTIFPKGHLDADGNAVKVTVTGMEIVRRISMEDLRALLWASFHEYDKNDEPVWPLTISQVGRRLDFKNVIPIFVKFLTGVSANSPSRTDMGESQAEATETASASAASATPSSDATGGEAGIRLPAGALD